MSKKLEQMTPQQIRERGRELLRLAKRKEEEVRNRQLVRIGEIFQREIQAGWITPWSELAVELEAIMGCNIEPPHWGLVTGGQRGVQAPLVEVSSEANR